MPEPDHSARQTPGDGPDAWGEVGSGNSAVSDTAARESPNSPGVQHPGSSEDAAPDPTEPASTDVDELATRMPIVDREAPAASDWRAKIRGSGVGNLIVIGVTLLAVIIGAWLVMRPDKSEGEGESGVSAVEVQGVGAAPVVGDAAPGFSASTLDGSPIALDDLRGRPVWLVFMATWCTACRVEIPDVEAFHEKAGDDVEVIAVYVGEEPSVVQPYVDRLGLSFTQLPDAQTSLSAAYGVMGVPAHYFLDSQGVVQETRVGVLSPDQIEESIAKTAA